MLSITLFLLLAALSGYAIGFVSSRRFHRRAYARAIERRLRQAAEAEAQTRAA